MNKGKLITSPTDKRKFTGFASEIPKNKMFTAEEIGHMSIDEFEDCEEFIDNQMKNFGIPNNFQVKQEVKAGNLIWVDSYTRGRYRSKRIL